MTNTRLTDPEVMEQRFPVRLLEFSIRRGSGGQGRFRGGDGTVRRIEFLKSLDLSILSQRRGIYPPFGLEGGQPGRAGRQVLYRANGTEEELPAAAHCQVQPGDVLVLETPGGGAFGSEAAHTNPEAQARTVNSPLPHASTASTRLTERSPHASARAPCVDSAEACSSKSVPVRTASSTSPPTSPIMTAADQ